jgi:division protein CdvB (Snf7/Vps24/ESCRT-III family)
MSKLDLAISRLDAAMARLDAAVEESAHRGAHDRDALSNELAVLRQTYALLQQEARLVSDRLDTVIGRLHNVTKDSQ